MSKKSWIIFTVIVVGLLAGLVLWSKNDSKSTDVSNIDTTKIQLATDQSGNIADHTFGNTSSEIVLIEYGDFQCPPCGNAHPKVKQIMEKYSDKMVFVFRNFPIPSLHANARAAAAAAEAAGLQGKYWEMHDIIFENQSDWSTASASERSEVFKEYASSIGLDTGKFSQDLALGSIISKIDFDIALGKKDGVSGTPTFILNGETVQVDDLEAKITSKF